MSITDDNNIHDDLIAALIEADGEKIGYSIASAARALDVPVNVILSAIRRGLIQPRKLGRWTIISREALLTFYRNAPFPHDRRKRSTTTSDTPTEE